MKLARVLYANGNARWTRIDGWTPAELTAWMFECGEFMSREFIG